MVPVRENKETKIEESEKKKVYSDKELSEFARSATDQELKRHAGGSDENMRIAAKNEIERRFRVEEPFFYMRTEQCRSRYKYVPLPDTIRYGRHSFLNKKKL